MPGQILILDFGSQYTQLIARRVRELNVFCEIHPFNKIPALTPGIQGIILSGSPCSVRQKDAPKVDLATLRAHAPILGVCYGAQLLAQELGGQVEASQTREYGRAHLARHSLTDRLFTGISPNSQVWMSHGDTITQEPSGAEVIASSSSVRVAAFKLKDEETYGIQFHPEVTHSVDGLLLLRNFVLGICACDADWTPAHFVDETLARLQAQVGEGGQVVMALSGGVDSSVAAMLLHRAIGPRLHCIFVDNGLLRKGEYAQVLAMYAHLGLNITGIDARAQFYTALAGLTDPEAKRKAIGRTFIDVFDQEAHRITGIGFLGQGTIYPDVIESVSVAGPSVTIKSHHNVGGLPAKMKMQVVEPLRMLFKDEVRRVGRQLGLADELLARHPFPGPGLGIRILGEVTAERVRLLQEADAVFTGLLHAHGLYNAVWQAGAILLPINSVGVMGDERTYEQVVALRAVTSTDGMTADWAHLPYLFLAEVSGEIINRVRGINRVVYDISSKPPATIEWE